MAKIITFDEAMKAAGEARSLMIANGFIRNLECSGLVCR